MYFLIYTIAIFIIAYWFGQRGGAENLEAKNYKTLNSFHDLELREISFQVRGVAQEKINYRKNMIFNKILETGRITNNDVEKMFPEISDRTATRYLDYLEKDGKIKQIGDQGRGVYYTPIPD